MSGQDTEGEGCEGDIVVSLSHPLASPTQQRGGGIERERERERERIRKGQRLKWGSQVGKLMAYT